MIKAILAAVVAFGVSACASNCPRGNKEVNVIATQIKILSNLVEVRGQADFVTRLTGDPVLVQREAELIAGLNGVLESQRVLLKVKGGKIEQGASK